jgi:DNA repair exonuclease SbcCD ATPase subunit
MAETQTFLCDEILKSTYLMFKKMNVLSIGDNQSIYEMTKASKRDFIEDVFNLNVFGEMFKMVKADYNSIDKSILQDQSKYNQLEKDVDIYAQKIKTFQSDKELRISNINKQINDIETDNTALKLNNVDADDKIDKLKDAKQVLTEKLEKMRTVKIKLNNTINNANSRIGFKKKDIEKYSNVYKMVCDGCQSVLDESIGFTDSQNEIEELQAVLLDTEDKLLTVDDGFNKINDKLSDIESAITKLGMAKEQFNNQQRKVESNNAKLELLRESLEVETNKVSSFDDLYDKYNAEKDELYKELSDKLEKRNYLNLMKSILSEDGVKKHIISTLINALNNRIASYLEEMGSEYTVIFDPNFECQFLTTTGECEFNNFSAGEKMRLNHATMFAFQDIISTQGNLKTNILYCDELIDVSVDTVAIDAFLKILRRKSQEDKTIYLISHRQAVSEDEFDNVIEVKKENGFTEVVSDPQGES